MENKHTKPRHEVISKTTKNNNKQPFDIWKGLTLLLVVMVAANLYMTAVIANNSVNSGSANKNGVEKQQLPSDQPSGQPSEQQPPKVQVSADDDAVKGDPNAPVTIIEFSDFECPFCARFFQQTLPSIQKNYIDTGKVKFIYRDFPLSFHQNAQKAAEAAECAGEQGKYWEYHDKLFEDGQLETSNLKQYAAGLGLDTAKFNDCLDTGKMASEVKKDFNDGQAAGVTGTPAFFINGVKVVGAQPYSVFEQVIEQQLG